MVQPEIPGTDIGIPRMPYGSDGSDWIALLVSSLGALQVELASLPTGAVTIADGADVTLGALADALVAAGAVGSISGKLRRLTTDLDALLTELKLKADLTETQPISAASLPLPTSAATETTLDAIKTAVEIIDGFGDAQNLLLGYNAGYAEVEYDTDADVDYDSLLASEVPGDEVWIIQGMTAYDDTSDIDQIALGVRTGGWDYMLKTENPAGVAWRVAISCNIVMSPGTHATAQFFGTVAGDDIYFLVYGYKMKIS